MWEVCHLSTAAFGTIGNTMPSATQARIKAGHDRREAAEAMLLQQQGAAVTAADRHARYQGHTHMSRRVMHASSWPAGREERQPTPSGEDPAHQMARAFCSGHTQARLPAF